VGGVAQKVTDHGVEPLLRSRDVFASMQERGEFVVVAAVRLVPRKRVRRENRLESLAGVDSLVSGLSEILEVAGDLAFVPGEQDCVNV